jgi:Transport and Golgi organisation 2
VCTALISVDPGSDVPVLLLFARDEMVERAWLAPGRHWPADHPELVGGMDLREGGTWLAVRPGGGEPNGSTFTHSPSRMACLLNAFGRPAAPERKLTRGRLPLAAADGEQISRLDLTCYDPFHLLIAQAGSASVTMLTWDGLGLADTQLNAGTYLVSNRGLEMPDGSGLPEAPERAVSLIDARIRYFRPLLQDTLRPEPEPGHGSTESAWAEWMRLAQGDDLPLDDVRALIGKHDWGKGQAWMTSSVSLIALGRRGVRYDVNLTPGSSKWYEVDTAA